MLNGPLAAFTTLSIGGNLLVSLFATGIGGVTSVGLGCVSLRTGAGAAAPVGGTVGTTSNRYGRAGAGRGAAGRLAGGSFSRNVFRDAAIRFIALATLGSAVSGAGSRSVCGAGSTFNAAAPWAVNCGLEPASACGWPPLRCCTAFCSCSRHSGSDAFLFWNSTRVGLVFGTARPPV
jgi:hypothetical protein